MSTTYQQFKEALAVLKGMESDFSARSDVRFEAQLNRCNYLRRELWEQEQKGESYGQADKADQENSRFAIEVFQG